MMKIKDSFLEWYAENFYAINWFLIGFLVSDALDLIARQKPEQAVFVFALALMNYLFTKK